MIKRKKLQISRYNYNRKDGKYVTVPTHWRHYNYRIKKPAVNIINVDLKKDLIMDDEGQILKPFKSNKTVYLRKLHKSKEEQIEEINDAIEEAEKDIILTKSEKDKILDLIENSTLSKYDKAEKRGLLNELDELLNKTEEYELLDKTTREALSVAQKKEIGIEHLNKLKKELQKVQKHRWKFNFKFKGEGSSSTYQGKFPYVARIRGLTSTGKFDRKFKTLKRDYDDGNVFVFGEYGADPGDILEIQKGDGSRTYWFVDANGKKKRVAKLQDSKSIRNLKLFLNKDITQNEFLKKVKELKKQNK